jgi:hypothetical protein
MSDATQSQSALVAQLQAVTVKIQGMIDLATCNPGGGSALEANYQDVKQSWAALHSLLPHAEDAISTPPVDAA